MILNARDKITRCSLSWAKTPLLFDRYYRKPSSIARRDPDREHELLQRAVCHVPTRDAHPKTRLHGVWIIREDHERTVRASRKPVVHLHGFGEPLLDPLLSERIKLAKTCGIRQTYIVTNASLLSPETARKIINAGLDTMKISFYGTDEESYHATMRRLDFEVALNNIRGFVRIRKELKKRTPKLILQYLPQEANGAKTEEFQSLWRSVLDKRAGDCLNLSHLDNFGGGRAYNIVGERIVSVCFYPWAALSVLCDGRAVTCCMDYNGVQGVGDLNFQSVMEIWNGPVLSAIRRNFGKLDYSGFPTCLRCDWVRRR